MPMEKSLINHVTLIFTYVEKSECYRLVVGIPDAKQTWKLSTVSNKPFPLKKYK